MQAHEESALLHQFLVETSRTHGRAVAILDDDRATTFDQLVEQAFSLAAILKERGLGKGDRVALLMPKSTEAIISLFATLLAGGIYVPLEPRWPSERIESSFADCTPHFVVMQDQVNLTHRIQALSSMPAAAGEFPPDLRYVHKTESSHGRRLSRGAVPGCGETDILPEDPALILFTSGSTGRPKGVTLSHKAVAAFVEMVGSRMRNRCA